MSCLLLTLAVEFAADIWFVCDVVVWLRVALITDVVLYLMGLLWCGVGLRCVLLSCFELVLCGLFTD